MLLAATTDKLEIGIQRVINEQRVGFQLSNWNRKKTARIFTVIGKN